MTIQKKILIWFSSALFVIVFLVLVMSFFIAETVLNENIRQRLYNTVVTNASEIEYYNSIDGLERESRDQYIEYNHGWLEIDDDFCDFYEGISTGLFDDSGNLLYGSSPVYLSPEIRFTFLTVSSTVIDGEKYYIYEVPLNGENFEGLWLRGIVPYKESIHILYTAVRMSFWILPILAFLAFIGGYIITRRSFLPVEQIAREADKIGESSDLSLRIDIGEGNDELHMLVNSFNSMFDKLERSFQAEKQFTSDASHELRTPLSVILAQTQLGLELSSSEEDYIEALEVIQRQGIQMKEIIDHLLFFARLDQGSEPVSLEETNISTLVDTIAKDQSLISVKNISLYCDIEPNIYGLVDIRLFTRLVNNLLSNSYKYGKENGSIWLSLKTSEDVLELSVKDDGLGISPEDLDKIWNRFYQVNSSRSDRGSESSGLGLGLSMVKEISELLGGTISVQSILNKETTFIYTMPKLNK